MCCESRLTADKGELSKQGYFLEMIALGRYGENQEKKGRDLPVAERSGSEFGSGAAGAGATG